MAAAIGDIACFDRIVESGQYGYQIACDRNRTVEDRTGITQIAADRNFIVEERVCGNKKAVDCNSTIEDRIDSAHIAGNLVDITGDLRIDDLQGCSGDTCDDHGLVDDVFRTFHRYFTAGCDYTCLEYCFSFGIVDCDVGFSLESTDRSCDGCHEDAACGSDRICGLELRACQCHITVRGDCGIEAASVVCDDIGTDGTVEDRTCGGQIAVKCDSAVDDCKYCIE